VLADVAGDEPAIEVIAASDAVADDQINNLAAIEISDALRRGMPSKQDREDKAQA